MNKSIKRNKKNKNYIKREPKDYQKESIRIPLKYGIVGILWILITDKLLDLFIKDHATYQQLQSYKGWFYVFSTMLFLYILIHNKMKLIQNQTTKATETNEALNTSYKDLKNVEDMLEYQKDITQHIAYYDSLTGLPNRDKFEEEVRQLIQTNTKSNRFAFAFIDIDNFKYINNTLGHHVGDEFLKYIGNRLVSSVNTLNLVSRLGGDEFGIILKEMHSDEALMSTIEDIKKICCRTWDFDGHQFFISMSIGVVSYPDHGDNLTDLLIKADIAMYHAKQEGKNRIQYYKEDIQVDHLRHIFMAKKLQSGIENEEFTLYYQPQFKLTTGELIGLEALVRWIHPKEGIISPVEFISVAEETGQIYTLERWIFKKALQQKKDWEKEGIDIDLSINLSSKTLTSDINFSELEKILDTFEVNFPKVTIEITETALITNADMVIERLNRLKAKGFKIALDDFGTGYSSLTYLGKFPIDIIKLDRSYINLIPQNVIDTAIVKNVLSLAHDLKYRVVAEGIETSEQLEYLKEYYCESGQGFLLSKPLSIDKVGDLLIDIK